MNKLIRNLYTSIRGFTTMRYINRLFTYLLTYLLTYGSLRRNAMSKTKLDEKGSEDKLANVVHGIIYLPPSSDADRLIDIAEALQV